MALIKILLGARIREIRKANGLTQEQLAVLVNIEQKHVSCIERGKNAPTIDRLQIISEALDVPIMDFFDYTNKTDDDAGIGGIDEMLKGLDVDKRKLADKIIRDIIKTLQET